MEAEAIAAGGTICLLYLGRSSDPSIPVTLRVAGVPRRLDRASFEVMDCVGPLLWTYLVTSPG